ncbi:MAG: M20/M25/M40 family metallo-hydrolase [Bdellovibrionota bacterium]
MAAPLTHADCYASLQRDIHSLPIEALEDADAIHPNTSDVLANFVEISKISRPSEHEAEVRAFLIQEAHAKGFEHSTDDAGNLLIIVPSNIKGGESIPSVLIQSHLDIVPKVKGIDTLKDALAFYQSNSGVMPLEWKSGSIQSKDQHNTIGADNGSGVAIMMEYMRNPELPHPRLELLFTVEEETGLIGATQLGFSIESRIAISLDSGAVHEALIGSIGAARLTVNTKPIKREAVAPGQKAYSIKLSGLEGGHSGMKIGLGRANATHEATQLALLIKEALPELNIVSLNAGTEGTFNAIPNKFSIDIALAPEQVKKLKEVLFKFEAKLRSQYRGIESFKKFSFVLQNNKSTPTSVLNWSELKNALLTIDSIPDGSIRNSNTNWPRNIRDWRFSSNTAFIAIDDTGLRCAFMPRFFETNSYFRFMNLVKDKMTDGLPQHDFNTLGYSPPWQPQSSSHITQLVSQNAQQQGLPLNITVADGGVEASILAQMYPDMDIVVIGAEVSNPHEESEAMPLVPLAQTIRLLDDTLQSIISENQITP